MAQVRMSHDTGGVLCLVWSPEPGRGVHLNSKSVSTRDSQWFLFSQTGRGALLATDSVSGLRKPVQRSTGDLFNPLLKFSKTGPQAGSWGGRKSGLGPALEMPPAGKGDRKHPKLGIKTLGVTQSPYLLLLTFTFPPTQGPA